MPRVLPCALDAACLGKRAVSARRRRHLTRRHGCCFTLPCGMFMQQLAYQKKTESMIHSQSYGMVHSRPAQTAAAPGRPRLPPAAAACRRCQQTLPSPLHTLLADALPPYAPSLFCMRAISSSFLPPTVRPRDRSHILSWSSVRLLSVPAAALACGRDNQLASATHRSTEGAVCGQQAQAAWGHPHPRRGARSGHGKSGQATTEPSGPTHLLPQLPCPALLRARSHPPAPAHQPPAHQGPPQHLPITSTPSAATASASTGAAAARLVPAFLGSSSVRPHASCSHDGWRPHEEEHAQSASWQQHPAMPASSDTVTAHSRVWAGHTAPSLLLSSFAPP